MNTVSTSLSHVAIHGSWWSRIANPAKPNGTEEKPSYIDTEDFSDHMLRDVGLRDGRPRRGDRVEPNDLNAVLNEFPTRSL